MLVRRVFTALVLVVCTWVVAACGDVEVTANVSAERPYHGPLFVGRQDAEHPGAGAAGNVVDCRTWGAGGFSDVAVYAEGATADSAESALQVARSESIFSGAQEGLTVAKTEPERVLYVLEVAGVVKQAVIAREGPATEGAGGPGWYVESWAHCDDSELPRTVTDAIGLQIWTDHSGRPVPTSAIESWTGPRHCGWQSMTFLYLDDATYVRAPRPYLDEFFAEPYREDATLPSDAIDTGYEHDGRHLWLSPDRHRAYVGSHETVELWPRTTQQLACE